jgi:hypothetical protein
MNIRFHYQCALLLSAVLGAVLLNADAEAQPARARRPPTVGYSIEGTSEQFDVNESVVIVRRGKKIRTLVFSLPALCEDSSNGDSYISNLIFAEIDTLRRRSNANNRANFTVLLDPLTNAGLIGNADVSVVFRQNTAEITIVADAAQAAVQCGFTGSYSLRRIRN